VFDLVGRWWSEEEEGEDEECQWEYLELKGDIRTQDSGLRSCSRDER
jgi:hypothetical protein